MSKKSVNRRCSLRCIAITAPIIASQMNESDTTSSIQTTGRAKTYRDVTPPSSSTIISIISNAETLSNGHSQRDIFRCKSGLTSSAGATSTATMPDAGIPEVVSELTLKARRVSVAYQPSRACDHERYQGVRQACRLNARAGPRLRRRIWPSTLRKSPLCADDRGTSLHWLD